MADRRSRPSPPNRRHFASPVGRGDGKRKMFLEQLEDRRLLAVGPQIIGIQPNDGDLLAFDDPQQIRSTAPRELLFRFDENQVFDTANLDGIQITRANLDGGFAAAQVQSDFNTGVANLRFTARKLGTEQNGITLVISKRDQGRAGAPEIGVVGNRIDINLNVNPGNETRAQDLVDALNSDIDASALILAELVADAAGDTHPDTDIASSPINYSPLQLDGANDEVIQPGFIGIGESSNEIVVRFADSLPDDLYRIDIYGEGKLALRNNQNVAFGDLTEDSLDNGQSQSLQFELDLGAQITAVVPQPVQRLADGTLSQARDQILVYFNDDDLDPASAENVNFYQLIFTGGTILTGAVIETGGTVENTDDVIFTPASVSYNADLDAALLTFSDPLDELPIVPGGAPIGPGTFRLRIGTDEAAPAQPSLINLGATDPGSSFNTAHSLNAAGLETQSLIISQDITPDYIYDMEFPSPSDEPGHREHNVSGELHLNSSADANSGMETFFYNFREQIGIIPGPGGTQQPAFNLITEVQKQRAREIFEIFSSTAGVQFVETAEQGIIVATGDLAAMGGNSNPGGTIGLSGATSLGPAVIMDNAELWHDEIGRHRAGELSWFLVAMHELGHQMGLGHAYDLPSGTVMGNGGHELVVEDTEPVFPGNHDITHLQHLHRPEGRDIDLYEFNLSDDGLFTAETIAERQLNQTTTDDLLDTHLALYQVRVELDSISGEPLRDSLGQLIPVLDTNGSPIKDQIARNDDYFSNDSFLELDLREGQYFIAVSASGNWQFDPAIESTGLFGKTQGSYDLRLNFRPDADAGIVDLDNPVDAQRPEIIPTRIDADGDGVPGGVYNQWFRAAAPSGLEVTPGVDPRVVYVDKSAAAGGIGTLGSPFKSLKNALNVNDSGIPLSPINPNAARATDILRIVGNAGIDADIRTELDNRAYEIGFNDLGVTLSDGAAFHVPHDVTVMVDAGAVLKMRRSWFGVGSVASGPQQDHSAGSVQIVGAPVFVDALGNTLPLTGLFVDAAPLANLDGDGNESAAVHFTSYNDESLGLDTFSFTTTPAAGDWGGIFIRRDIDNADQTRFSYEQQGIFLDSINHGDIRYGGGEVLIESVAQIVDPIEIIDGRPTISFNEISFSRDAAIAASPDSFLETNFHSPQYQTNPFTSDYSRIGPDILRNDLHDNTINGLFVRINTPAGGELQKLTVPGRWDDKDIVHVLTENLVIEATPGGPIFEAVQPSLSIVTVSAVNRVDGVLPAGDYNYRLVFVDKNGNEGAPSQPTATRTVGAGTNAIQLGQLLTTTGDFVARRLYRSSTAAGAPYTLIAQINQTDTSYIDLGAVIGGTLDLTPTRLRPQLDARLRIDPALIVKIDSARIDMDLGGQLIAEGRDGHEIIFTTPLDDRYGVGGTFDTTNDGPINSSGSNAPQPGSWGGIHATPTSRLSVDHAIFAYGGGITRIEGTFAGFNVIEIHQADARIANSIFEFNAGGVGGQSPDHRFGRGFNRAALIFVRGAQPIIVDNIMRDNVDNDDTTFLAALDINVNSLNSDLKHDYGRATGYADAVPGFRQNHGPLVLGNRLGNNEINGMVVRGEVVTTMSIWDDTDIVHVVLDQITVPDLHTYGGLRLSSSPTQSLVVKLQGVAAGFVAKGQPLETIDRVGGVIQIIGQPKSPVVLTSFRDDSQGAGVDQQGDPQVDTNNDGASQIAVSRSTININYDNATVSANAQAEISRAKTFWERTLKDPITIGLDVSFSGTLPTGVIGQAAPQTHTDTYDAVRQRMIADATPAELIVTQLPTRAQLQDDVNGVSNNARLTQANALALGYLQSDFANQATSTFGTGPIHGTMQFRNGLDLDPQQLYLVALHEIGHSLGFISSVGQANPALTTFDMFRMAPGAGIADFTNATRVMSVGTEQVFYDGGIFDPAGIPIGGLTTGDIPLSNGSVNQPSHWKDDNLVGGVILGVMDPSYEPNAQVTNNDKRALDLMGWDLSYGGPAAEGDWNSILLGQYSHDRNVEIVIESESFNANAPGANATARNAQFIGALAPHEKGGDENLRLGFEVHGFLSNATDRDVFSFEAEAGSEVWIDFDRTSYAFDPIVELLDGNDLVLAASYNERDEKAIPSAGALFEHSSVAGTAFLSQKTPPFQGKDFWAINPRDPGFRLILPGPADTRANYHLRVRSNTAPGAIHDVNAGLTSGAYQLQMRLREVDELPGSTVRYADIAYASTAIAIYGMPIHSPLAGESAEDEGRFNDTRGTAQVLGNLMTVDRGTLSVAGNLRTEFRACLTGIPINCPDVDWYSFTVDINRIQDTSAFGTWPVIFDFDYADGLGRPDTELSVYSDAGELLYHATASNVAQDQPGPNESDQLENLTRGTIGKGDTYIGPVNLAAGQYFVAVSGQGGSPEQLSTNLALRMGPIDVVVEDPADGGGDLLNNQGIIPWHLGDVGLYVLREKVSNYGGDTTSGTAGEVRMVNAFTGHEVVDVNSPDDRSQPRAGSTGAFFNFDLGDIAMREDGRLRGFSSNEDVDHIPCNLRDEDAGHFIEILDHEVGRMDGAVSDIGSHGIQTYELDPGGNSVRANDCNGADVGFGFNVNAMTFGGIRFNDLGVERLLAVGERADEDLNTPGVDQKRNIMFEFDPDTGAVLNVDGAAQSADAWTNAIVIGQVLTGAQLSSIDVTSETGNPPVTNFDIDDGDLFGIDDGLSVTTFEIDFGPQVLQQIDQQTGQTLRDGDFFVLDTDDLDDTIANEHIFQFDTGAVINIVEIGGGAQSVPDGSIISIQDNLNPSASFSFEFDTDDPAALTDPQARRVGQYSTNTPAITLAGLLASTINAAPNFGVTATAIGTRVTLTGEFTASLNGTAGTSIRIEGDGGANPMVQITDPDILTDGDSITIGFTSGLTPLVFEFDSDGSAIGIAVPFTAGQTASQVATSLHQAIVTNGVPLTSKLDDDTSIVSINGQRLDLTQFVITTLNPGAVQQRTITRLIQVEETDDELVIGPAVAAAVDAANIGVDSSAVFSRLSFLGADIGFFKGVGAPTWIDRGDVGGAGDVNNIPIGLLAEDLDNDVALKVAQAINDAFAGAVSATASGSTIDILDATPVTDVNSPFTAQGAGPGGDVTGITTLPGGRLFAVSDRGGLYELTVDLSAPTFSVITQFVPESNADLKGIAFEGLTNGPANIEQGRYANVLFGIDEGGRIYAFNDEGVLQPILLDGASSVETGITSPTGADIRGLEFAPLDDNLWHATRLNHQETADPRDELYGLPNCITVGPRAGLPTFAGEPICVQERWGDADHGNIGVFQEGVFQERPTSYHFGEGRIVSAVDGTNILPRTYDYAGGAHGTIVSEEFSLRGYSAADAPILYFTYFLDPGANDTARVFISDNDGSWQLLQTLDETDGVWQQARLGLEGFAGVEHLRLRYDFSTAGGMNLGDTFSTGSEMRAVEGRFLRDGETVELDRGGIAIQLPVGGGLAITGNEQFVFNDLTAPNPRTFTLTLTKVGAGGGTVVSVSDSDSAGDVAGKIVNAINDATQQSARVLGLKAYRTGSGGVQVMATDNTTLTINGTDPADPIFEADDNHIFEFESGFTFVVPSAAAIPADPALSQFTIEDGDGTIATFEFTRSGVATGGNVAITITDFDSPATVANNMATAIEANLNITTHQQGERLNLEITFDGAGAVDLAHTLPLPQFDTFIDGRVGTNFDEALDLDPLTEPNIEDITLVYTHEDMTRDDVADEINRLLEPHYYSPTIIAVAGTELDDGQTFALSDGTLVTDPLTGLPVLNTVTFEFDTGFIINVPTNGEADITDGETLTFEGPGVDGDITTTADNNEFVLEFDPLDDGVNGTNTAIVLAPGDPQLTVANALINEINSSTDPNKVAIDLQALLLSGGRVQVYAVNNSTLAISTGSTISQSPTNLPNVVAGNVPVRFSPSTFFAARDVAAVIEQAINIGVTVEGLALDIGASRQPSTPRRIQLERMAGPNSSIIFTPDVQGDLSLERTVGNTLDDVVKQHRDLIRIIGHTVVDTGPLGLADSLPADGGQFITPQRLQDNRKEGFYLDDISIGFRERGAESRVGADGVTLTANTDDLVNRGSTQDDGEYQLEIRRGSFDVVAGYDTNNRFGQYYTITAQDGSDIHDGETFDISDGVNTVRFEYDDAILNDGVQLGNVLIAFDSTMTDWEVARIIRDAVNTQPVVTKLPIQAGLSDGATNVLVPDHDPAQRLDPLTGLPIGPLPDIRSGVDLEVTTTNRVNLYGPVYVVTDTNLAAANLPVAVAEPNEILANAQDTLISGFNSFPFLGRGRIGDNPAYPVDPGLDVDIFQFQLNGGDELTIDVDAQSLGSPLDARLRVFDTAGTELGLADGVVSTFDAAGDPQITFTPPAGSTFYVGVSGANAVTYDAFAGTNTIVGSTGFYEITMTFGVVPTNTDFDAHDQLGDQNLFRDQGQILIHSNRISYSLQYGIDVDGGNRTELDGESPHPGPVRHLEEIHADRLLPGVVVANNLITRNLAGGIRFSGQNQAGPPSPVSYGRIYNNTIVGLGGDLMPGNAINDVGITIENTVSPTLLNNVVANHTIGVRVESNSSSTIVGGMLYQGNLQNLVGTTEDFAIVLQNVDPLFVEPTSATEPNYYLAPGSPTDPNRAIDSSISSLEDRFRFNLIKAPIGIPPSPIIAPDRDVTGQLRVDDPATEPSSGLGSNVFIDRGALDRSDFSGPVAQIVKPRDNDANGNDLNLGLTTIRLSSNAVVSSFEIRLNDGIEPADPNEGIGIADSTIATEKVIVTSNGQLLHDNIDYSFSYNSTNDTIQLTPLSGIWTQDRIYTISLINTDQWSLVAPHGHDIADGTSFHILDQALPATQSDFEFDRGFTIQVPQTLELQVPVEGGGLGGITDGEVFTVRQGTNPPVTFEFDSDAVFGQQREIIQFSVTSSAEQIASDIRDAFDNSLLNLGLNPVLLPDGRVHLGSKLVHTLDTSLTRLDQTGVAGGVADTGSFTIDDSSRLVIFEFEDDDVDDGSGGLLAADVLVHFTHANTHEEIADLVVAAINAESLGLSPVHLGGGEIYVGGELRQFLNTDQTLLSQTGNPGVRPALSLQIPTIAGQPSSLNDAETFTIQIGTSPPVTFELNNLDVDPAVTLENVRIDYTDSSSVSQLAGNIVVAIQGAGLNMDPVYVVGTGIVTLGEDSTAAYALDFSNTSLVQLGSAGTAAAIQLDVLPLDHFDGTQVAVEIIEKINTAVDIVGIAAKAAGGAAVVITGANRVAENNNQVFLPDAFDVSTPRFIDEIEDLATNPLKANQLSRETKFTVLLGDVSFDLGDAPDGVSQPPQAAYPTLTNHDPAIHMITDTRLALGTRIDRDAEGQSVGFTVTADVSGAPLVVEAEQFSITVGNRTEIFEFDLAGDGVTTDSIEITVSGTDSAADVAATIRTAIIAEGLGVTPQEIGNASLLLGSNAEVDLSAATTGIATSGLLALGDDLDGDNYTIDVSGTALTSSSGTTPAQLNVPANGGADLLDGETFTISDGSAQATFEFEDRGIADGVTFGNIVIDFGITDTLSEVSTAIVNAMNQAVQTAGLDLNLNPIHVIDGVIELDGDDEDGVQGVDETGTIGPIGFFNAFVTTNLQVTASEFGLLDGWVDFNRDGDWDDAGEQVFSSQQLQQGVNSLTVQAPLEPASKAGLTYARFRISSSGGLSPTGLATDGEVEDYEVEIVPGRPPEAKNDPTPPAQFNVNQNDLFNSLDLVAAGNDAGNLLFNDVDADGDPFRVIDVDGDPTDGVSNTVSALGAVVVINTNLSTDIAADTGTFSWDPSNSDSLKALVVGQIATDTFTYDLVETSAHNFTSQTSATVSLTVTGLNDQPTATPLDLDAVEDGSTVAGSFVGDDPDADNDATNLLYDIVTSATVVQVGTSNTYNLFRDLGAGSLLASGSVTKSSIDNGDGTFTLDGTFTFDPNIDVDFQELAACDDPDPIDGTIANLADCQTQVSFTYTATDIHTLASDPATVTFTVSGENDSPLAVIDDFYIVDQDQSLITVVGPPAAGEVAGVLFNDSDIDNGDDPVVDHYNFANLPQAAAGTTVLDTPLGAEITLFADGTFDYDPTGPGLLETLASGSSETETFTYTIIDGQGVTASTTVEITVNGVNNPPLAADDGYQVDQFDLLNVSIDEGLIDGQGLDDIGEDTDPDVGDSLRVLGLIQGDGSTAATLTTDLGGVVTLLQDANGDFLGDFSYDPTPSDDPAISPLNDLARGTSDDDTFEYIVIDVNGLSDTAQVTITVDGVNKPPVAVDDNYTVSEDDNLLVDCPVGLIYGPGLDSDVDDPITDCTFDNPLVLEVVQLQGTNTLVGQSDLGAVVIVGADGIVQYKPNEDPDQVVNQALQELNAGEQVLDKFTYTISDGQGGLATADVFVTVTGVNDAPRAFDDLATTPRGDVIDIPVTDNDTDVDGTVDGTTLEVVDDPANGATAIVNLDGTITFTPPDDTSGLFTFTYTVNDNSDPALVSLPATVTVLVNDPPVAADDEFTAVVDVQNTPTLPFDIVLNDTDTEDGLDRSTVTIVQPNDSDKGILTLDEVTGEVTYTPDPAYFAENAVDSGDGRVVIDTFRYTIADTDGAISSSAEVTINITEDTSPWQNKVNPFDVNADGSVSPIDALIIITYLNEFGSGPIAPPTAGNAPPPFYDTNGDNQVVPGDINRVITELNINASADGEGEGEGETLEVELKRSFGQSLFVSGSLQSEPVGPAADDSSVTQTSANDMVQAYDDIQRQSVALSQGQRASGLPVADGNDLEDLLDEIAGELADASDESAHATVFGGQLDRWDS